jgi:hypothetical protein
MNSSMLSNAGKNAESWQNKNSTLKNVFAGFVSVCVRLAGHEKL